MDLGNRFWTIYKLLWHPFELFGVRFVPLCVPIKRRIQTLAALHWICEIPFSLCVAFVLLGGLFLTPFRWISILYITWYIYDFKSPFRGGWNWVWFRTWQNWKHFANYFPVKLVKTHDLDPDHSYLICNHPHGVLCAGAFAAFGTEALEFSKKFPGLEARVVTLPIQFYLPLHRDFLLATGTCASTKKSMEVLLKRPKGQATILIPGGAAEAWYSGNKKEITLVLNKRKGFIRLAIRHGVHLVPSFSFGENCIFNQVKGQSGGFLHTIQSWVKRYLGFIPVIVSGRGLIQYNYGFLPHRVGITVVVGQALPVEKNDDPTEDQVDELHAKYVQALRDLYDQHKEDYGDPKRVLVIE